MQSDVTVPLINEMIQLESINANDVSDGYHTFGELYDHRVALFIALCNEIHYLCEECGGLEPCWKSKLHHDGTSYDGWFIAGIHKEKGEQISYHLPMKVWDDLNAPELDKAPEWDGHTPADVLERVKKL